MNKKRYILFLPLTLLIVGTASVTSLFYEPVPVYISIYLFVLFLLSLYTAKQSIFIQTSFMWEIDDTNEEELSELSYAIAKDFGTYLFAHGVIITIIYFCIYWVYSVFN